MTPPDILLTHGYFTAEDPSEQQATRPIAPLDMLYLSSYLKSKDFKVEVFDTTFAERDELYDRLRSGRPSTLCIYADLGTHVSAIEIVGVARLAGWTTIVDGPEPGANTQEFLDAGANFIVVGESEATTAELLAAINIGATSARVAVIQGIAYLGARGELQQTPARKPIDLNTQPWPDRAAIDLKPYLDTWRTHHGKTSLQFATARNCAWESNHAGDSTCRRRDAKVVVDEIEWLIHEYNPDQLITTDEVFPVQISWLREFAANVKTRALHTPICYVSESAPLNNEAAHLLADLGCPSTRIGSESDSELVLDTLKPPTLHETASGVEI